jgi:hypothetical protein
LLLKFGAVEFILDSLDISTLLFASSMFIEVLAKFGINEVDSFSIYLAVPTIP